jgi:urease accessory protein UreE
MPLMGNEHVLAMKMANAMRLQRDYIIGVVVRKIVLKVEIL